MFTVSCPNCSATYQLDETKLGPQGRKLKCARCGHIWVAMPPAADEPPVSAVSSPASPEGQPAPVDVGAAPVAGDSFHNEDAAEDTLSAESENAAAQNLTEESVPEALAPEPVAPRVELSAMANVARYPWSRAFTGQRKWLTVALALCCVGALGAGWVLWGKFSPRGHAGARTVAATENTGVSTTVPVVVPPPSGVVLQRVKAQFTKVGEGVVLNVNGVMRNASETAVNLPLLRVELLGADGKVQDMWPVNLVTTTLLPTMEMPWSVSFTNPDVKNIAGWRAVFVR